MEEHYFDVDVFSILVKEILEKVRHWLVRDVPTDDYVPVSELSKTDTDSSRSTTAQRQQQINHWMTQHGNGIKLLMVLTIFSHTKPSVLQ